jgi:transcriptional regulator GlxA family with amidase domain
MRHDSAMHRIAVLALEELEIFDLGLVEVVFESPVLEARYEVEICGSSGGPVRTTHGYSVNPTSGLEGLDDADTVVIPGFVGTLSERILDAIRAAHRRGARLVSVCTGAFGLARAGILDGRPATTHWLWTEELAASFPEIDVRPDVLYIDDGDVLTSAGTAAGLDLCLHIVRQDHGAAVANDVARRVVVAPHRDGGQAQYISQPMPSSAGRLSATLEWAAERLGDQASVETMAGHAHLSIRHFNRLFSREVGATPHTWLNSQRVLRARDLLESTDLPIDDVAQLSGFNTAAALREHFRRRLRTSPSAYRSSFRSPPE